MTAYCNKCGQNYDPSKRHDCPEAKSLAEQLLGTNDSDSPAAKSKPAKRPQKRPVTDDNPKPDPTPEKVPEKPKKAPQDGNSLRDKQREYARRWRENNPEAYKESQRRYRENNKETLRERRREYMAAYRKRHQ